MLKNVLSNGYSSQVRGWLVIDGIHHELAQVGPDFCILRESISSDQFSSDGIQAELVLEVDGSQRKVDIILTWMSLNPWSTRVRYKQVA